MGLGDELMAAGEAQRLSKIKKGNKVAILDKPNGKLRWHPLWANNPHIAKVGDKCKFSIVNGPGYRGYIQEKRSDKWIWKNYRPIPAEFFFSTDEKEFAESLEKGFVVVEPGLKDKPESVNRDWGWDKFVTLTNMFPNINWVQLGPEGTKVLPGVRLIKTASPRMAAAALTKATSFVSHEGGLHHMAAAVGLRGVVIYGGFTSQHVSGYDIHRHLSIGPGIGCGSRIRCTHCQAAMNSITPEMVSTELIKALSFANHT